MGGFGVELNKALDLYRETFKDSFPTIPLAQGRTEDEIVQIIHRCVKENKDVYELGYLTFDDGIQY